MLFLFKIDNKTDVEYFQRRYCANKLRHSQLVRIILTIEIAKITSDKTKMGYFLLLKSVTLPKNPLAYVN